MHKIIAGANQRSNQMKRVRKIARILTLPIVGKERRRNARYKTEAFLHKLFKTEYYRCEQIYKKVCEENKSIGFEKYHLISLGNNCFGRITFSYWGLKPRKADGEKSMPFDISIHPLPCVIKMLTTHFANYFDAIEYSSKDNFWRNPELKVIFPHDKEDDKNLFVERYKNRIQALYEAINDNKPCLFFAYQDGQVDAGEINKLYKVLSEECSHKPFKLIYMVFNASIPAGIDENIATYQANYPQGYVHMDKFTKYKKAGLGFEKAVVEFTAQQLRELIKQKA